MSGQAQVNLRAREAAREAAGAPAVSATSLVEFQSRGRVLIVGNSDAAFAAAESLPAPLQAQILQRDDETADDPIVTPLAGRTVTVEGHLGNFRVLVGEQGCADFQLLNADIILDLSPSPLLSMALKPPGYLAISGRMRDIELAIGELPEFTGTFDKPRYFEYDPAICAHSRSGQAGCRRCLEACPAEAIASLAESIEVDPYRCQGGGICAAVCPSGAIRYAYPRLSDLLERIRKMLGAYLQAGGVDPAIAFVAEHDAEASADLPPNTLVVVLEELASAGLETWLSALAYGARRVLLIDAGSVPKGVIAHLNEQVVLAGSILAGLGYPEGVVAMVRPEWLPDSVAMRLPAIDPAKYAGIDEKRKVALSMIDYLADRGHPSEAMIPLPAGAPFGSITIDADACTLCMSCTAVCPVSAVLSGDQLPRIDFVESNCVQCGICRSACPESAISLEPRLNLDPNARRRVTLHEEPPFCCVSCGKPFATRSMIDTVLSKLAGHSMFTSERALRRLKMCDGCRVVDVVQDDETMGGGMDGMSGTKPPH